MPNPSPDGFSLTGKALSYLPILAVWKKLPDKKSKNCWMIAKNIKGCVNYVMNKSCELLEADGVWAENAKDIKKSGPKIR